MITWLFLSVFFPPILLGVLSNKIIEKLDFNKSTFRNDQKQRSSERDILSSDKLNIYPAFYPGKGDGVKISMHLESIKDLKDILVETGYFLKKSDLIKIDNRRVFHIFIKGPEDIFEEVLSVLGHMINSKITLAKVLKGSSVSFCMNSEEGNLFEGDLNDVARELVVKGQ